ncbi:MAG: hypothetical protein H7Y12_13655 [Sphingobacteriaceae bacterium]|nr:hypothetical protein [Cytophagaceae bacterium]
MPSSLPFWNFFSRPTRRFYQFALGLLVISALLFTVAWLRGLDTVLHWDVLSELGEIPFTLDRVPTSEVPAVAYTVTEQLVASPMAVHESSAALFAGLWLTGLLLVLTGATTLNRLGFSIGTGLFMLVLVSLNLDALAGRSDRLVSIGVVALYGGLAFYLNAFRPNASLPLRFGLLLGLTLVLCGIGTWQFPHFALHVASHAQPAALLLGLGLIFLVSFEILNGFLFVATQSGGSQGLLHFVVISAVYLLNLLLLYLYNVRTIDWKLLYLSPFLIFLVSVGLGVWGVRRQTTAWSGWLDFEMSGAFLYAGLALAGLAAVGYAFATANDPLVEVYEDGIVYAHLVMGALYVLYVVVNFGQVLNRGLDAWKVVYKPVHWPLGIYRGAALVGMAVLLAANKYFPFYQTLAGYYNGLGDLETARADFRSAEAYYQAARQVEFQNHKTNYALASLALVQGDPSAAGVYFKEALRKQPSPYAYAGLARMQAEAGLFFDALFTLREGFGKFPESGALANNLAYQFSKTGVVDSTEIYYRKAARLGPNPDLSLGNALAFRLKQPGTNLDSLLAQADESDYVGVRANLLTIAALTGKGSPEKTGTILRPDSALGVAEFAYLANVALLRTRTDQGLTIRFDELAKKEANAQFFDDLQYLQALQDYYGGDKLAAFDRLEGRAAADTGRSGAQFRAALTTFLIKEETTRPTAQELAAWRTAKDYETALGRYPLNADVLTRAMAFFNQAKQPQRPYDALLLARRYRPSDPDLTKLYIRQSLTLNLRDYAAEAMDDLELDHPAVFAQFLPVYQAQLALIEKQADGFQ